MTTSAKRIPGTVHPTFSDFAVHHFWFFTRGPLLAVAATYALEPLYRIFAGVVTDDTLRIVFGAGFTHLLVGLTLIAAFHICDRRGYLAAFKLPRTARMTPSKELHDQAVREILIYTFVAQFPLVYFGVRFLCPEFVSGDAPLPVWWFLWYKFAAAAFVQEIGLYLYHRFEHENTWMYRNIHKKHHLFVGVTAWSTEFTTLLEKMTTLGSLSYFSECHILTYIVWVAWRVLDATETHSGYDFRDTWLAKIGLTFSEMSLFHNDHHTINSGNYGSHWLRFDGILGTCDSFLQDHAGEYPTLPLQRSSVDSKKSS